MIVDISDEAWTSLTAVHAAATWFLVGLIWTIQLVHYPGFRSIDRNGYRQFQVDHMSAMGRLVGAPWLIEGITVIAVFVAAPDSTSLVLAAIGGVAEAVAIGATVLASIPAHSRLASGFDPDAHRRLVSTNWIRTIAWSVRGLVAALLLVV